MRPDAAENAPGFNKRCETSISPSAFDVSLKAPQIPQIVVVISVGAQVKTALGRSPLPMLRMTVGKSKIRPLVVTFGWHIQPVITPIRVDFQNPKGRVPNGILVCINENK
jgi:hypothetical protein